MTSFVELTGVGKTYQEPHGRAVIVENFDLNIAKGESVSLLGGSGCGKSTILTMVAGLTAITDGGILVDGHAGRCQIDWLIVGTLNRDGDLLR